MTEQIKLNGKSLQGQSSPKDASDPVQMSNDILLFNSSSNNARHPSSSLEKKWRYDELILISRELDNYDNEFSINELFDKLNKLNNFLSFFMTVDSKSKEDIKIILRRLSNSNSEFIVHDKSNELGNIIEFFLDTQYTNSIFINSDFSEPVKEGNKLIQEHFFRERDLKIIKAKKNQVLVHTGAIKCEVCEFDYSETYGPRGHNYIEVHHKKPISEYKANDLTKLSDLSVLCSSCHRMIHRCQPWLTIEELKNIIYKHAPLKKKHKH